MSDEVFEEPVEARITDSADSSLNVAAGDRRKKPQADHRGSKQAGHFEIVIATGNNFVEIGYHLMELSADTARENVSEWRKFPKEKHWPDLCDPINLGELCEGDVTLSHAR